MALDHTSNGLEILGKQEEADEESHNHTDSSSTVYNYEDTEDSRSRFTIVSNRIQPAKSDGQHQISQSPSENGTINGVLPAKTTSFNETLDHKDRLSRLTSASSASGPATIGASPRPRSIVGRIRSQQSAASSSGSALSQTSVNSDICRICHMGCCQHTLNPSVSAMSLGLLVSACRCRGTVGLVHTKCLERWLTESGKSRCELCGYRYATIRVPRHGWLRSVLVWLRSFLTSRQMLLDSLYLVVTTPLACFSAYVCAMSLRLALENRFQDVPWTIVAMLPTCSLTLVAYWGWLVTLRRLHGRRWRQYWRNNYVVRLVPPEEQHNHQQQESTDEDEDQRQQHGSIEQLIPEDFIYDYSFQQLFDIF